MKKIIIFTILVGFGVMQLKAEDIRYAITDGEGRIALIATTTDQNRGERVTALTTLLTENRTVEAEPDEMIGGAFLVLAAIGRSQTPLAITQQYVDDASLNPETRSLALYALGQVARQVSGEQVMIQTLRPYLRDSEALVAQRARLSIASTNTPEAVSELEALLAMHLSALPDSDFVITEQNGKDMEARFGAVALDAEALNGMGRSEAKVKAQETLTYLRNRYPSGPGLRAVQYLEQRLAQP